jgi:hypothetical protein
MRWKNTLKVFALVNSLLLFSVFLLVKGDYIDVGFLRFDGSTRQVVENSIELSSEMPIDTLPKVDSIKLDSIEKRNMRLLGSKSGVLIDMPKKTEKKKQDTVRKKKTTKQ